MKEKSHKQPRGYLRTCAALVGKDTKQPIPFNSCLKKKYTELPKKKEAISKMTAITGNYLFQLWQRKKNHEGWLTIKNLTSVADVLGITTQRLKLYLVCLSGYEYSTIILEEISKNRRRLSITLEKLCDIEFIFNLTIDEIEETGDDLKIGTRYQCFIKSKYVTSVEFKPICMTVEQFESNGLGNILVSDSFVPFCLGLSDMAYRLLCYTGSNKPTGYKISFSKIVKPIHLNLEKQLKQQGKTRILRRIENGFKELNNNKHIKKIKHIKHWNYDDEKEEFSWEYTNQLFKHPAFTK